MPGLEPSTSRQATLQPRQGALGGRLSTSRPEAAQEAPGGSSSGGGDGGGGGGGDASAANAGGRRTRPTPAASRIDSLPDDVLSMLLALAGREEV